ncbi:MAG: hypothetical protein DYH12_23215 [Sorangiineae bacterium PRO1]|nr:hypothetical protein [Sorangiineae bacterium PRO1]
MLVRTLLEVFGVTALLVSSLAGFVAVLRWHDKRRQRIWSAAAARMGGELRVEPNWPGVSCAILVEIDGQRVEVRAGRKHEVFATAAVQHPEGFMMSIHPKPPSWLASKSPVMTGDPVFDLVFVVESSDPALCRVWLDDALRETVSRAGEVWVEVRGGRVLARRTVFDFQEDALDHLARATASIAGKVAGG